MSGSLAVPGRSRISLLAGEEGLLATLPRGDWIGGTIPYCMTADRIFATGLPGNAATVIRRYIVAAHRHPRDDPAMAVCRRAPPREPAATE